MKLQMWSVGKAHDPVFDKGIGAFSKRLENYYPASWQLIGAPKNAAAMSEQELRKQEGKAILGLLQPDDFLVLLDERGKMISSVQLAAMIQQRANESTKRLIFLIGGAFGVDETVKQRAQFSWSLSQLVFPHMLARLILAEQLYRACTINRNEKYHHE
jgi:23S rRNA (pseudouridine1915-N3)-methyltransferase